VRSHALPLITSSSFTDHLSRLQYTSCRRKKGGCGTNKFNDNLKNELLKIFNAPWDRIACPRCNGYNHAHILDCWDDFKTQQHWDVGQWKVEDKLEKQRLDAFFKEQQKAFVEEGKFTPKFKPNPSVPRAKQASILPSSSTSSKASNANQTTS
jgi:hypothetical protein